MTEYDEKGNPLQTGLSNRSIDCQWCGAQVPIRKAGRTPRFCTPAHRVAHHRAQEAVATAEAALIEAHQALKRAKHRAEHGVKPATTATGQATPFRYDPVSKTWIDA